MNDMRVPDDDICDIDDEDLDEVEGWEDDEELPASDDTDDDAEAAIVEIEEINKLGVVDIEVDPEDDFGLADLFDGDGVADSDPHDPDLE